MKIKVGAKNKSASVTVRQINLKSWRPLAPFGSRASFVWFTWTPPHRQWCLRGLAAGGIWSWDWTNCLVCDVGREEKKLILVAIGSILVSPQTHKFQLTLEHRQSSWRRSAARRQPRRRQTAARCTCTGRAGQWRRRARRGSPPLRTRCCSRPSSRTDEMQRLDVVTAWSPWWWHVPRKKKQFYFYVINWSIE